MLIVNSFLTSVYSRRKPWVPLGIGGELDSSFFRLHDDARTPRGELLIPHLHHVFPLLSLFLVVHRDVENCFSI